MELVISVDSVADVIGVVGITDYAQQLLGDVVFVELPPVDVFVARGGT
jgi:glycine cleavage system H lipoate-binding protein